MKLCTYNIFIRRACVASMLMLLACKKDYLDLHPSSNVIRDVYVSDLKSCEALVNGVYLMLGNYLFHGLNNIYAELSADNVKPFTGNQSLANHYTWAQIATDQQSWQINNNDQNLNGLYTAGYAIIRHCNYLLENIDKFKEQEIEKANSLKGQALALRALIHHQLVLSFAQPFNFTSDASHLGVPYVTTSDYRDPIKRNTVLEVYEKMIEDLHTAVDYLPSTLSNRFVVNRKAAQAILARVFLFKGDYQNAKKYSLTAIDQMPILKSADYPAKLFTKQDVEAYFQLPPATTSYYTVFASYYYRQKPDPTFIATNDIASIINENSSDKRRAWVTLVGDNYIITKFPVNAFPEMSPSDSIRAYCHDVIRASELYLNASESYAKIGNKDSSIYYLDLLRIRANLTAMPSTVSETALLDSIYRERRRELAFEGLRLYDILRLGQNIVRKDASTTSASLLPYPSTRAIAPLPFFETTLSDLPQNSGY